MELSPFEVFDIKLLYDECWDLIVTNSYDYSQSNPIDFKKISFIDMGDSLCVQNNIIYSHPNYKWDEFVNKDVILDNIGLTGIDNGLINYSKDRITNEEFLNILLNSKLELINDDYRLILNPIISNSKFYNYETVINDDYISFKGGFYQGFYKIHCQNYQILPSTIENEWEWEFNLRPMDYNVTGTQLNTVHPNNKGIFFYIGTRAENKFWEFYDVDKTNLSFIDRNNYTSSLYNDDYFTITNNVLNSEYIECYEELIENPWITDNETNVNEINWIEYNETICSEMCYVDCDYLSSPTKIDEFIIKTSDEYDVSQANIYEITTDNKFLLFNKSENGYNVKTYKEGDTITYSGIKKPIDINYFLLFNRSKEGYNVHNIDEYLKGLQNKYNIIEDITNNAFGLIITNLGQIGYRYLIRDCDNEKGYSVKEEYSKKHLINNNEWSDIKIKIKNVNDKVMVIYFYLNNNLILISEELPIFEFKCLNDLYTKQEGVPFSLSIGGGTQGLCERIWLDYYKLPNYILPIEENFCGTFIGDIKSFNFSIK